MVSFVTVVCVVSFVTLVCVVSFVTVVCVVTFVTFLFRFVFSFVTFACHIGFSFADWAKILGSLCCVVCALSLVRSNCTCLRNLLCSSCLLTSRFTLSVSARMASLLLGGGGGDGGGVCCVPCLGTGMEYCDCDCGGSGQLEMSSIGGGTRVGLGKWHWQRKWPYWLHFLHRTSCMLPWR